MVASASTVAVRADAPDDTRERALGLSDPGDPETPPAARRRAGHAERAALPAAQQRGHQAAVAPIGVIHQSGWRVWRGCNRPPTEVLADGCIGHPDPDFSDEHRRGSGGARRARLVLSVRGAAGGRRLRDPQRELPPGARRSARRPVWDRERCRRTCRAAVGLRRCVVRPWCWPCWPSGPRPDRSRGPAANPRSRTRLVATRLRALPLVGEEARKLWVRAGPWPLFPPRRESVAKRPLACLTADAAARGPRGFPPVARETAEVPGRDPSASLARIGSFVMPNCGRLRLGPRGVVIRQDVEKLAPGGLGGSLGPGSVDVGRVVIGAGSARGAGRVGVGDRPVSRGGAGDRVCCVREVSMTGRRTPTKHIRLRTAR